MSEDRMALLVLAAGMGSRYGKMKQIEEIGPGGESIMEYSLYDAVKAGFKKVVFVINKEVEEIFNEKIISKYQKKADLSYVIQKNNLPEEFAAPEGRSKPWGTGHAVLAAKEEIDRPFAVVNADDFYGPGAYKPMAEALSSMSESSTEFCMLAYVLKNALSDNGRVSRGLCEQKDGFLTSVTETVGIMKEGGEIFCSEGKEKRLLYPDSLVSMNFWGFSPKVFQILEERFKVFLKDNLNGSAEFFITEPLGYAIENSLIRIKICPTSEKWMGVTYLEDKPAVVEGIRRYISRGAYPAALV